MKIAVVGSRNLTNVALEQYLPCEIDEIISGGAVGVDTCAAEYAKKNGIPITEILPQDDRYGRAAPLIRNQLIVDRAEKIFVFWNGQSRGTLSVIEYAAKKGKPCEVFLIS